MARFRLRSGGRVDKICRRTGLRVGRERKETFMIPRTFDLASRVEVGINEIGKWAFFKTLSYLRKSPPAFHLLSITFSCLFNLQFQDL